MFTRRRLFGLIAAAPFTSLGGAAIMPPPKIEDAPDRFNYRGYDILWTGWKYSQGNIDTVGQWVARNGDKYFYASSGGGCDVYHRMDLLDIGCKSLENHTNVFTEEAKLKKVRKRTLDNLIALLHKEGF